MRWVLIALAVVAFLVFGAWVTEQQKVCEDRGGVYLMREFECVPGMEERP